MNNEQLDRDLVELFAGLELGIGPESELGRELFNDIVGETSVISPIHRLDDTDEQPLVIDLLESSPSGGRVRSALLVAAAAVFVVVGGFAAVFALGNGEQDVATADGSVETGGLPTLPGDLSTAQWREVVTPFVGLQEGTRAEVRGALSSDGVAWAVGWEGLTSSDPEPGFIDENSGLSGRAAVWRSTDGEEWEPVDLGIPTVDQAVELVTDIEILEHAVTTSDGAIWVFGLAINTDLRDGPNGDFITSIPIGYRSIDGESWQQLQLPSTEGVDSGVRSVSTDGNRVLAIVDDIDFAADGTEEVARAFTTTDGETWNQLGEPVTVEDFQQSLLVDGELLSVSSTDLAGETSLPRILEAGPEFFVVLADDFGRLPSETTADEAEFIQKAQIWISEDAQAWRQLEVPDREDSNESAGELFAHDAGVLAVIDIETAERSEDALLSVDETGVVEQLGTLPTSVLDGIFQLNGEFFLIGTPQSANDSFEQTPDSVWVAEFPPQSSSTENG